MRRLLVRAMNEFKLNSNIQRMVEENEYKITQVNADDLLIPERFDVAIKYTYFKHYKNQTLTPFIVDLYLDHIRCINGFVENDDSKKIGKEKFLESFNELIDSIESNGYNSDYIIPVNTANLILDGAHRLATLIGSNREIRVLNLDAKSVILDCDYFCKHGLSERQLDFAVTEYAKLDGMARMIVLWPLAEGFDSQLSRIFEQYGKIVYSKLSV